MNKTKKIIQFSLIMLISCFSINAYAFFGWGTSSQNTSYSQSNRGYSYESAQNNHNQSLWQNVKSWVNDYVYKPVAKFSDWAVTKVSNWFCSTFKGYDIHNSYDMPSGAHIEGLVRTDRNGDIAYIKPGSIMTAGDRPVNIDGFYYRNSTWEYGNDKEWSVLSYESVNDKKAAFINLTLDSKASSDDIKSYLDVDSQRFSVDIVDISTLAQNADVSNLDNAGVKALIYDQLNKEDMVLYVVNKDQILARAQVESVQFPASAFKEDNIIEDGAKTFTFFNANGDITAKEVDISKYASQRMADVFSDDAKNVQALNTSPFAQAAAKMNKEQQQLFTTFTFPKNNRVGVMTERFSSDDIVTLMRTNNSLLPSREQNDRFDTYLDQKDSFKVVDNIQTNNILYQLILNSSEPNADAKKNMTSTTGVDFISYQKQGYVSKTDIDKPIVSYVSDPTNGDKATWINNESGSSKMQSYDYKVKNLSNHMVGENNFSVIKSTERILIGKDKTPFGASMSVRTQKTSVQSDVNNSIISAIKDQQDFKTTVESPKTIFTVRIEDKQSGAFTETSMEWQSSTDQDDSSNTNEIKDISANAQVQDMLRTNYSNPIPGLNRY